MADNKKNTKRENFKIIMEILESYNRPDLVEIMAHEIELLDKKRASGKMTKTQTENIDIKQLILDTLATLDRPVTITELLQESPELAEKTNNSNQKVSALMTQLKNNNQVVRTTEGKKALFTIAE